VGLSLLAISLVGVRALASERNCFSSPAVQARYWLLGRLATVEISFLERLDLVKDEMFSVIHD
jgi:hypothetical protein